MQSHGHSSKPRKPNKNPNPKAQQTQSKLLQLVQNNAKNTKRQSHHPYFTISNLFFYKNHRRQEKKQSKSRKRGKTPNTPQKIKQEKEMHERNLLENWKWRRYRDLKWKSPRSHGFAGPGKGERLEGIWAESRQSLRNGGNDQGSLRGLFIKVQNPWLLAVGWDNYSSNGEGEGTRSYGNSKRARNWKGVIQRPRFIRLK